VIAKIEENTPLERVGEAGDGAAGPEAPPPVPALDTLVTPPAVDDLVVPPAVDDLVVPPAVDDLVVPPADTRPREDVVIESSRELLDKFDESRKEKDDSQMYSIKNFGV